MYVWVVFHVEKHNPRPLDILWVTGDPLKVFVNVQGILFTGEAPSVICAVVLKCLAEILKSSFVTLFNMGRKSFSNFNYSAISLDHHSIGNRFVEIQISQMLCVWKPVLSTPL